MKAKLTAAADLARRKLRDTDARKWRRKLLRSLKTDAEKWRRRRAVALDRS